MSDSIKIKICGVKTAAIAEAAVAYGADMIGVVFVEESARYVTYEQARSVGSAVAGKVELVGLFVDGEVGFMRECVDEVGLTMLQLHGGVDEGVVEELSPIDVLRAVSFERESVVECIEKWNKAYGRLDNLKGLIVDTPDPAKVGGGTGVSFDWSKLREVLDDVACNVPIILAGGLTPENVGEAIRIVRPSAVDVSSGVESSRGVKDVGKIRVFCEAVRGG